MIKRSLLFTMLGAAPLVVQAEGTSPWLPIPGGLSITVNYVDQSGDTAFIGDDELDISAITGGGASDFDRNTTTLLFNYGISDSLALDAAIGYGEVEVGRADADSGVVDSTLGISWRVLDEYATTGAPTITLRGGLIVGGDYDGARLASLGNDEDGYDLSVLVGKQVSSRVSLSAEVGHQNRSGDVPNAFYYRLGGTVSLTNQWSVNLVYSSKEYSGNLDIGGPGFSPDRFQEVAAEEESVQLTVGYAFTANQGIALTLGTSVGDGSNVVVNDEVVGLSYTYSM